MNTHFIGDTEVTRYARDFAERLLILNDDFPLVWLTIGESGEEMAAEILPLLPEDICKKIQFARLEYNRINSQVSCENTLDWNELEKNVVVLVLDSSVHSGNTMAAVVKKLHGYGISHILSYALVLKRGACFIPNYFGLVIDDHDRALFKLEKYANNRLCKKKPFGTLRKLDEADVHRTPDHIESGLASIKKMTWGDLWYEKKAKSSQVYVYELNGEIKAFLSFKVQQQNALFIDAIATSTELEGVGIGGVLMRWAETWARSANCNEVNLWSIDNPDRIGFYEHAGFTLTGETLDLGNNEKYRHMHRVLLYNLDVSCIE